MKTYFLKFKALVFILTLVLSTYFCTLSAYAGNPQKPIQLQEGDVKILASGTSTTENEAIATALRSALEQAYGTFVSANTTLVNDELIKDEIVSITTGNIRHYDIINSTLLPNGNTAVMLNAIVSTENLVKYAQNHGSSTELAGNKLALAMRLEQMNIDSERKTMENLMEQLESILPNLFDYGIEVGEPNMISTSTCEVPLEIIIQSNQNTLSFQKLLKNTLLSMPDATGKIDNVKCQNFVLFGNIKRLTWDIWGSSFYQLFSGLISQLTAFDIVDQNDNILGGVKFTPDARYVGNNDKYRLISVLFYGHVNTKIQEDYERYRRAGFGGHRYFATISTMYSPNAGDFRYFNTAPKIDLSPKYFLGSGIIEALFPCLYDHSSGKVIFPFPEIVEASPLNKKTKKSKAPEAISPSTPLFRIQGLILTLSTEELNKISEIRVIPN